MRGLDDELVRKIRTLNETVWEKRVSQVRLDRWLDNFSGDAASDERLQVLYLLSQFMFFGRRQILELLRALFRDLYKYPIVAALRRGNGDTRDPRKMEELFLGQLRSSRFLGVGNPAESGTHLLYYFRQVNSLPKDLFIHTHQIFRRYRDTRPTELRDPTITRYVFIDDLCSSGHQAIDYSRELVEEVKGLSSTVRVAYYSLFALAAGIARVRAETMFDEVGAVFLLDDSFKCFNDRSRYFTNPPTGIDRERARTTCHKYGASLCPDHPLGYNDDQLLLGFHHNVPDNTLPIIWNDGLVSGVTWEPVFLRYPKVGG